PIGGLTNRSAASSEGLGVEVAGRIVPVPVADRLARTPTGLGQLGTGGRRDRQVGVREAVEDRLWARIVTSGLENGDGQAPHLAESGELAHLAGFGAFLGRGDGVDGDREVRGLVDRGGTGPGWCG